MSPPRRHLGSHLPFENDKFYSAKAIAEKFDVHHVTPWKWAKQGRLPKPRKIGPNTSRWLGRELNEKLIPTE
jgi:predicted DNA-binding transcriptional regulator AlpA